MHTNFIQDKIESEAEELISFIENDADLRRQQFVPIVKNIHRRLKSGTYEHEKAPKLWSYIVDAGAKKYHSQCTVLNYKWHEQFPIEIRKCASQLFANKYFEKIFIGDWVV